MTLRWTMLVLLPAVLVAGCGSETKPPDPTPASLTAEGWAAFEAGDLALAGERFLDALALDADYADAHTGLGWIAVRGGDVSGALDRFDQALAGDPTFLDARASRVLAAAALDRNAEVRDGGLAVLSEDPAYVFPHDPDFAASDLRWLVARAALNLGAYGTVITQLDVLAPGHGLNPNAARFVEDALALLESLAASV